MTGPGGGSGASGRRPGPTGRVMGRGPGAPSGRMTGRTTGRMGEDEGRTTARREATHSKKPLLSGPLNTKSLADVLKALEGSRTVAYLLASDALSEKCVFFPAGGLRLTSMGTRRGRTLRDAIRRHPQVTPDMVRQLDATHPEDEAALGEFLEGDLREIAKECAREVVRDELIDLVFWSGAEFEFRDANPPPAIFDAEMQAVKLSFGVKKVLDEIGEINQKFAALSRRVGDPNRTTLAPGPKKPQSRLPGAGDPILRRVHQRKGSCTLDDAVIAARQAGFDAIEACEAALQLKQQGVLAIDTSPPTPSPEVRKARARTRIQELEGSLEAFINQVEAMVNSSQLSPEEAQPLIDAANAAIDEIESDL